LAAIIRSPFIGKSISWFLVGKTDIRYMSPVFLEERMEDPVTVGDHNVEKGYAKLDFGFGKKAGNPLVIRGHQGLFIYEFRTGKKVSVPKAFLKLLES